MLKVGITGGIGSGKTMVCSIFSQMGVPVYASDDRAKMLLQQDAVLISQVKNAFGEELYQGTVLDRKKLAAIVFNDNSKLQQLNGLVHPAVAKDYANWLKAHAVAPYTLKEAAIMIESGAYESLDALILVTAPKQLRINRVVLRDEASEAAVLLRMEKQLTDEEKRAFADFEIVNDEKQLLLPQIASIHTQLMGRI